MAGVIAPSHLPLPTHPPSVGRIGTPRFESLIDPIGVDSFLAHHWEQEPLLIERNDPYRFTSLPTLDDLDELITSTTSGRTRSAGDGRLVKTGDDGTVASGEIPLDSEGVPDVWRIYRAYSEGYTLVLNRLHRRSAAVALLCTSIEAALHHPVGANLYLTPANGQGFRPHVDTHDVFIVQLHGAKEWRVGDAPIELPLDAQKPYVDALPTGSRVYVLTTGDVLYLPRGVPHEAVTAEQSSMHLTIGVHVFRWVDLIREALEMFAETEFGMRQALPTRFLDRGDGDDGRLADLAARFARAATDEALADRAKERLAARLLAAPKASCAGHFRSLDGVCRVRDDTVVTRVPGLFCRVRVNAAEATIAFADNFVSGPASLATAFRFIAGHDRFGVGEIPGAISAQDRLDLVRRLVTEGLLDITNPDITNH